MVINGILFNASCEEIIDELRSQLALNGINLLSRIKDTPDNIMVSCPYHKGGQELKPSGGIKKSDGVFHCFTCQETHSLQELISFCFGYTDDLIGAYGWQWLLRNFLSISTIERKSLDIKVSRDIIKPQPVEYVSDEELESYRYIHPYMYKRKLTDPIIELFDIGFDRKRRCITFPVRDITGGTLFVARRSIDYKYFNYPSNSEKPLYGLYELYHTFPNKEAFPKEIIVVESMLDAHHFWVVGKYAVALNGLGTNLQFRQLSELPCRVIIFGTDMDDAGIKARNRIAKNVTNKMFMEYVYPDGRKDANDCSDDELLNLVPRIYKKSC